MTILLKSTTLLFCISSLILVTSCKSGIQSGNDLSLADLKYIENLNLLEKNEVIILFDSQGGIGGNKVSGNFFTNKRVASYWTDDDNKKNRSINYAYYKDIDTIKTVPLPTSLTYSSYLEIIKTDGKKFKVHVDAEKKDVMKFFTRAVTEWKTRKNAS